MAAPLAAASEEATIAREGYVAQAEPICKRNVLANKQIFKGVKGMVKMGKLKLASAHFKHAAAAFAKTIRELAVIPRPSEDEARLGKWFTLLRTEKQIITRIALALAAEDKHKAESLAVELKRNSNQANNSVLLFEFNYCRIEPSRFE